MSPHMYTQKRKGRITLDGTTIYAIRQSISGYLPAKVQRVYQPGKRQLIFHIWNQLIRERLVISLEPGKQFFGFSDEKPENPQSPPAFCLALRKRLEGGVLERIRQKSLDRVLYLDFSGHDDLGNVVGYTLVVDFAGARGNVGLYKDDCLEMSMLPADGERFSPGKPYIPPAQDKIDLLAFDAGRLEIILGQFNGTCRNAIVSVIEGSGKELAASVCHLAGIDPDDPCDSQRAAKLVPVLGELAEKLKSSYFEPAVYCAEGSPPLFHVFPLVHYSRTLSVTDPVEGAKEYRRLFLEWHNIHALKREGLSLLRALRRKLESKYEAQQSDLQSASDYEKYRRWAELIDASGVRQPPGASSITVTDYYQDPPAETTVPLDPRYSSRDNARRYYARYAKMSRAYKILTESIRETADRLAQIADLTEKVSRAQGMRELQELMDCIRKLADPVPAQAKSSSASQGGQGGREPQAPEPSLESIRLPDGALIFVGGSARQNDFIVTKVARPGDIWFHARGVEGAHVLLRPGADRPVGDEAIIMAARIAAARSRARNSAKVEVDFVDAQRVKKPRGSPPGFVVYSGQKTVVVSPHPET